MFLFFKDSYDCLHEQGMFAEPWYLSWLWSVSVIIIATISIVSIFLSIVTFILFREIDLRVHLSFSPTKQYVLAKLTGFKIRSLLGINLMAYLCNQLEV